MLSLFRPCWYELAKYLHKLVKNTDYRKYELLKAKYGHNERYKEVVVDTPWDKKFVVADVAPF